MFSRNRKIVVNGRPVNEDLVRLEMIDFPRAASRAESRVCTCVSRPINVYDLQTRATFYFPPPTGSSNDRHTSPISRGVTSQRVAAILDAAIRFNEVRNKAVRWTKVTALVQLSMPPRRLSLSISTLFTKTFKLALNRSNRTDTYALQ